MANLFPTHEELAKLPCTCTWTRGMRPRTCTSCLASDLVDWRNEASRLSVDMSTARTALRAIANDGMDAGMCRVVAENALK